MSTDLEAWFEALPLPWHRACVSAARDVLPREPGVLAVWVAGSLGRGDGDAYSDLDLSCLVTEEAVGYWRERWREVVARCVGDLVLARTIDDSIIGGFTLTADWRHVDLVVHTSTANLPAAIQVLHDPHQLLRAEATPPLRSDPAGVADLCEFFLYLAGSFTTLVGRGELVLAQDALMSLRQWLVWLMLVENGLGPPGLRPSGTRRLNALLSADQRHELESTVVPPSTLADASTVAIDLVECFSRRARRLTAGGGTVFPERLHGMAMARLRSARESGSSDGVVRAGQLRSPRPD